MRELIFNEVDTLFTFRILHPCVDPSSETPQPCSPGDVDAAKRQADVGCNCQSLPTGLANSVLNVSDRLKMMIVTD